jgi:hypothetical protein
LLFKECTRFPALPESWHFKRFAGANPATRMKRQDPALVRGLKLSTGWIVERKAEPRPVFSGFLQELSSRAPILQFLAAAR